VRHYVEVTPPDSSPIDDYLQELWTRQASDLLLTAGSPPLLRIDGVLVRMNDRELTAADTAQIIDTMLDVETHERFRTEMEVDFSFGRPGLARFRINAFHQRGTAAIALRVIPFTIPGFADLDVPAIFERIVALPQGLVLVTGPTGSGKSTTLASLIDRINEQRACHIVTIEDPIEYLHQHKQAAVNQREIGVDALSFPRAVRAVLREDPDVVLVGELRDTETIAAALTVAETGHLVFASLHTNDAPQSVDRIVDVFPAGQQQQIRVQLADSLQAIISQRLVPKIGGGRVAAFEVLIATHAVRNIVREGRSSQLRNQIATGAKDGMQTLEAALSQLITAGVIDRDEAVSRSVHAAEIEETPRRVG
jgi:twitching motility protein PilT